MQDVTAQRATEERIRALNEDLHERIAERETLLEAAEASREAAERSSRAKDEFLAVLSHELRSPMQSVLGWVQVLRSTPLEAEAARRALDTIERNLRQQTQLINDMLDVSRIVTGKLVFHLATLPLGSVVRETIDELRPAGRGQGPRCAADDRRRPVRRRRSRTRPSGRVEPVHQRDQVHARRRGRCI